MRIYKKTIYITLALISFLFSYEYKYTFSISNFNAERTYTAVVLNSDQILLNNEQGLFYDLVDNSIVLVSLTNDLSLEFSSEGIQGRTNYSLQKDITNQLQLIIPDRTSRETKRLSETTVRSVKTGSSSSRQIISGRDIRSLPGAGNDPLRAIENLPGVVNTGSFFGGFYIRGGNEEDTLYTLDGI